ncbi:MAG: adenosylcobinamide amidohydrolase [Candidatus Bathyarchaeota archaeon]|nr:adenosylcobinamide amidohydrolase [Candidatus Bathyarchaeota archaeon]
MKQFELVGKGIKLVLKENVLAVISDEPLNTVSSAFHNGGGIKKTKAILNVEVTKSCSDQLLHSDPHAYIVDCAKKFGLNENFIGMVTAASVENFALVSKSNGNLAVSVIATAADNEGNTCNFSESAGEAIEVKHVEGTINIIVIIDGNPTESCLVSTVITATEAKAAALKELDIRSRFSGDQATGTVTDAVVVAETGRGAPIIYAGPASELGQLVGYCTRKAVKEAVMKANECMPCRSIFSRLKEMHLPVEKLALELSKVKGIGADEKTIAAILIRILRNDPLAASVVLAAAKMADEVEKGLVPPEFGQIDVLSKRFGEFFNKQTDVAASEYASVNLPPFLKDVLIGMMKTSLSEAKTENLK